MMSDGVEIIFRGVDQISAIQNKVIADLERMGVIGNKAGDNVKAGFDKAGSASRQTQENVKRTSDEVIKFGGNSTSSFNKLTAAQQQAVREAQTLHGSMKSGATAIHHTAAETTYLGQTIRNLSQPTQVTEGFQEAGRSINDIQQYVVSAEGKTETWGSRVKDGLTNAWTAVKNKVGEVATSVGDGLYGALEKAKGGISSLQGALGGVGQAFTSAFGMLGLGSITQATIGLAKNRQQMTTLMSATTGSAAAAKDLVNYLDEMTNDSLVGLDQLGGAMNNIKIMTGMSNEEMKMIAPTLNDIGQRSLLMGRDVGSTQLLMTAYAKGLNGQFQMLQNNFGITGDQLKDLGWSGAADDIKGYDQAMQDALAAGGSMNEMMKTSEGQMAVLQKNFRIAGRGIGEVFLPMIDSVVGFLNSLNKETRQVIIVIGGLVTGFAALLPVLVPMITAFQGLMVAVGLVSDKKRIAILMSQGHTAAQAKEMVATEGSKLATMKKNVVDGVAAVRAKGVAAAEAIRMASIKATSGVTKADFAATTVHSGGLAANTLARNTGIAATLGYAAALVKAKVAQAADLGITGMLTVAKAKLNAVMMLNPYVAVAVAVIALVAALVHLYHNTETVKNIVDGFGNALKELGAWIAGGFIALWDQLVSTWNYLVNAAQPLINAFNYIGKEIGYLFDVIDVAIVMALTDAWNWLMNALKPVGDAFGWLGAEIGKLMPSFINFGSIVINAVTTPLKTIYVVVAEVIKYIGDLIGIFADLIAGNISVGEALGEVWESIKNRIGNIVQGLINIFVGLGKQIWSSIQPTLQPVIDIFNGIKDAAVGLGGMIQGHLTNAWNYLMQVLSPLGDALGEVDSAMTELKTALQEAYNSAIIPMKEAWNELRGVMQELYNSAVAPLKEAWNDLMGALFPVKETLNQVNDAITDTIPPVVETKDSMADLWEILGQVWEALQKVGGFIMDSVIPAFFALAGLILDVVLAPLKVLFMTLIEVIKFIAGFIRIIADLIKGNISLGQALGQVWDLVRTTIGNIIMNVVTMIVEFAEKVWDTIKDGVIAAWEHFVNFMSSIPGIIWGFLTELINFYAELPGRIWTILTDVIRRLVTWHGEVRSNAQKTGNDFLTNIINFVKQLPGKMWELLVSTVKRIVDFYKTAIENAIKIGKEFVTTIIKFITEMPGKVRDLLVKVASIIVETGRKWVSNATDAARNVVTTVINFLKNLPQMVTQELGRVGTAIMNAGSQWVNAAKNAAQNMVNGFKKGLGIASPGILARETTTEIGRVNKIMVDSKDSLAKNAKDMGDSISKAFKPETDFKPNPKMMGNAAGLMDARSRKVIVDNAKLTEKDLGELQGKVKANYKMMGDDVIRTLEGVVSRDGQNWKKINHQTTMTLDQLRRATKAGTVDMNKAWLDSNGKIITDNKKLADAIKKSSGDLTGDITKTYKIMNGNVYNEWKGRIKTENDGWKKVNNSAKTTLDSMRSATLKSVDSMNNAWGSMRKSINSESDKIKTTSSKNINDLSNNMKTFYGRLQNPKGWFAGNKNIHGSRAPIHKPRFTAGGPLIGATGIKVLDKAKDLDWSCCEGCYAGGWQFANPSNTHIKSQVAKANVVMPHVRSPLVAKDFETARMNPRPGDINMFEDIWRSVVSGSKYSFYFNQKHGSPLATVASGAYNCYDGALMTVALAQRLGYNASLVNGYWGSIPHTAAMVNGRVFDTSQFQSRGVARGMSNVRFGAPGAGDVLPVELVAPDLSKLLNQDMPIRAKEELEITVKLKHDTQKHEIDLSGLPDNMDEESIVQLVLKLIKENINIDPNVIARELEKLLRNRVGSGR